MGEKERNSIVVARVPSGVDAIACSPQAKSQLYLPSSRLNILTNRMPSLCSCFEFSLLLASSSLNFTPAAVNKLRREEDWSVDTT